MLRAIITVLCFFAFCHLAWAEEVIRNFTSDIEVASDGSLTVRETIVVRSEGREIKRGIQREFPTTYTDRFGQRVIVGFDVVEVKRDGQEEPWQTIYISNGERIRIGDKDVFLGDGEHVYKITYRTTRQIGFFDNFDELYWNVTGNGWTLPIEKATAIVRLPSGAAIKDSSIYTGRSGANGQDAQIALSSGDRFNAKTTRRLSSGEGFTIAVSWQKGVVLPPTEAEKTASWIRDNLGFFILGALVPLLGIYYFMAWSRVGRDPPGGTVIPLFHPPEGLGPAGVRYVWKQKFDDQGFAAALVGLAVKKRLEIREDDGEYSVVRTANGGDNLTRSEDALNKHLPQGLLTLRQSNSSIVNVAKDALSSALDDEYDGAMFLKNTGYFVLGAIITGLGLLLAGLLAPGGDGVIALFTTGFGAIWWGVIIAVGWGAVKGVFGASSLFTRIKSLMSGLFLLPFAVAGVGAPAAIWVGAGANWSVLIFVAVALLLLLFNFIFYWLLKAPTPSGRKVLDAIEGFRMYMTTAEEERLKVLHPPEKTPALFERYLPYAMALDCENEWNAKFAAVLAAASAAGMAATQPGWYHGTNWNSRDFSSDLNSGLTSSIASSSVAPGSSSGSGGGGFSGGGGGGGGGSGW